MKVSGELRLQVDRERLFQAVHDPDILRETVPGCEALEQQAPDLFKGTAKVGIGPVKGTYRGTVRLVSEQHPHEIRVAVEAKSGHAEIKGEGSLRLSEENGATVVRYEGESRLFGPLALVGQRLLVSASKSLTEQFFHNLEAKLTQTEPK